MFVAAASAIIRAPNHSLQANDALSPEKASIAHADAEARRFRLVERHDGSALPWAIASENCDAVPSTHIFHVALVVDGAPRAARLLAHDGCAPVSLAPTAQRMLHLAAALGVRRACVQVHLEASNLALNANATNPGCRRIASLAGRQPLLAPGCVAPHRLPPRTNLSAADCDELWAWALQPPAAHGEFDRTVAALRAAAGTHRPSALEELRARACPVRTARPPPPPPPPSWRHAFGRRAAAPHHRRERRRRRLMQEAEADAIAMVEEDARLLRRIEEAPFETPPPTTEWLRILGDSVTWNIRQAIAAAWMGEPSALTVVEMSHGGTPEGAPVGLTHGRPSWVVFRGATTGRLASAEFYFDAGDDVGNATVPAPPGADLLGALHKASCAPPESGRTLAPPPCPPRPRAPTLVYLSFGSHAKQIGGGHERRYRPALDAVLGASSEGLVLALETARATNATPAKFRLPASEACLATNWRVQQRNEAAAAALRAACRHRQPGRCRVADLFSASLPLAFVREAYRPGDPVHLQGLGWPGPALRRAFGGTT